jgi:hypothetical protein
VVLLSLPELDFAITNFGSQLLGLCKQGANGSDGASEICLGVAH